MKCKCLRLEKPDLTQILYGSAFLGGGGGGSIKAGNLFIDYITGLTDNVELLKPPFSKATKNLVACIACDIGSITQLDPFQTKALLYAFESLSHAFKDTLGPIQAVFPIETGPENMLAPFVIAATLKIPVVDGDGAGRAVPTLPLTTFAEKVIPNPVPVAVANGVKDVLLVSTEKFESLLRSIAHIDVFSDSASLALWPDKLINLYNKSVSNTVTRALYLGRLLEGIQEKNPTLIRQSLKEVDVLKGRLLIKGKVIFKDDAEKGGFNFTTTKIQSDDSDEIVTILSQNENLIAYSSKSFGPLVIAPDAICYLTTDFIPKTNAEIDTKEDGDHKDFQHMMVFCVVADAKLQNKKIQDGFHTILQELGYSGDMDLKQKGLRPLGSLLVKLSKP